MVQFGSKRFDFCRKCTNFQLGTQKNGAGSRARSAGTLAVDPVWSSGHPQMDAGTVFCFILSVFASMLFYSSSILLLSLLP